MVSVIVPVYNQAYYTANFIRQFNDCIGDTAELIIADDCSTDGTPDLVKEYGVNHLRNVVNCGFSITCNNGAKVAKGDILVFVNNDVLFSESFIPAVEAVVEQSPNCLFGMQLIDWDGGWNRFGSIVIPWFMGWFVGSTKTLFTNVGGFDEIYAPYDYEDLDLSYTYAQLGLPLVKVNAKITHLGGRSITDTGRRAITERNRKKFAEKWGLNLT